MALCEWTHIQPRTARTHWPLPAQACEHQIRRLPVVDRDKRLVGIVALGDFAVESADIIPAAEALSEISRPA